ncbi:Internal alternative NAD(P)H-ubiquinone oxidoreductase A1, mitochondrial [Seminavis robusta]|uniref:NADH:ubiquinone reductase (non-electrogenic) n=1 Tax=Seminavis robusta TaxID=568900 RepID=A0A9N8DXS8_9STRA|nr:Internal alternative NAD(P)H-ubiquinone oxidoreductase A1, mitochondrial [Seminavis robusta]|eukprot:Sro429_g141120.1 Internal alternative NAD(P)H-ubiquinone oxidoreductase A1, mitochondrial (450) ;mRNA; f:43777-45321
MMRTRALYRAAAAAQGEKIVVLGSGWGGFQVALNVNKNLDLTVVSPNNHFLFTPLLPSTAVGTLEFRCVQEPVRTVLGPKGQFLHGKARTLDPENKTITVQSVHDDTFEITYDKLVIAVGVKTNTFGIPSIQEGNGIFFLKTLKHARMIRNNIIDVFEKAAVPTVTPAERKRLLSFVVVGGGPTSCEFTSELHDFVKHDISRLYPDLLPLVNVTLVEAGPALLGPFDKALQEYAHGLFKKRDIDVRLGTAVTSVEDVELPDYHFPSRQAMLSDGTAIEFGTMVWSAGLAPRTFTTTMTDTLPLHPRSKRILVDDYLRVKGYEGSIWAIGDSAVNDTGDTVIPQLAQVARQQGIYLAKVFNGTQQETEKEFKFFSLGSMAYMGDLKGIYDGSSAGEPGKEMKGNPKLRGLLALLLWRFAYWGRQTSMVNKILIPMHWFKSFIFGRDTSRF